MNYFHLSPWKTFDVFNFFSCACAWAVTYWHTACAALSGRDGAVCFVLHLFNDFLVGKIQKVGESYSQKNFPQKHVSYSNFENASQNFSKFMMIFDVFDWCSILVTFIGKLGVFCQNLLSASKFFIEGVPSSFFSRISFIEWFMRF